MKTFFEKGHHADGRQSIQWIRVRNPAPRGIIFVPPLIGGHLSQQVRYFRWLIRKKYDVFTFNYSGHGSSSGKFSLGASMRDTLHMLCHTCRLSKQEGLPLFGIASCYSAIPILHAAHHLAEPIKKLVLINAIPKLNPQATMKSFLTYYQKMVPTHNRLQGVKAAIERYVDFLFPGIAKGKDYFGTLERSRTCLLMTVAEFFTLNPLEGICLKTTPVLCLYAGKDRVLEIYDAAVKLNYQKDIRQLCPQTLFHRLDGDHFLSLPIARGKAVKSIISFLQNGNPKPVNAYPASHLFSIDFHILNFTRPEGGGCIVIRRRPITL
jgi:hypothetical protein